MDREQQILFMQGAASRCEERIERWSKYRVVTADRCFTEACYDNWSDMIRDWEAEIRAGTHRIWVFG